MGRAWLNDDTITVYKYLRAVNTKETKRLFKVKKMGKVRGMG